MDQPVNRATAVDAAVPVDRLILQLRAYVHKAPKPSKKAKRSDGVQTERRAAHVASPRNERASPTDWVLIFDCETTTTPDQRLRFGGYQLRYRGRLWESGIFYDPDALPDADDRAVLAAACEEERLASGNGRVFLRTRAEFVEEVFYKQGFMIGCQIVGFNLPFDLSRLAIDHCDAQRGMKGGFSLELSPKYPRVAVRHLSQRSAFIQFVGTNGKSEADDDMSDVAVIDLRRNPDRGYFIDVKTLAATLGHGGSLATLSGNLGVKTIKEERDDHGAKLTPPYVRYGLRDVQCTWECFEALTARLAEFDLPDVGAYELYSEASLGKAYLRAMNVEPWRRAQPDFPAAQIGQILSGYFGGRAEVHIRRQAVEVLHCDFLSMYPTVCTLMALWSFVRATGIDWRDDTAAVRALAQRCTPDMLQTPEPWPQLAVMVQVKPDRDLFPVRAVYRKGDAATIGLNYLTADEPMWFTLADVLAAKVLTGKTPKILKAIRYIPKPAQQRLKPVTVAGAEVDPTAQDFYRSLIEHRQVLKDQEKSAATDADKSRFNRDQLAVKTLANATSYGIFVELNVEDYTDNHDMIGHGARDGELIFRSKKHEKPGQYFHPLLGALITGAARLMLALAERQVADQGLDWAFCDTDSLAIANSAGLASEAFRERALAVTRWFDGLNPYAIANKGSILQVEDYNYGPVGQEKAKRFVPLYCYAISAKRYALFNRGEDGQPIIRKASGHGLGHLIAPYDEDRKERRARVKRVGVPLWQEDLWREIIRAGDGDRPDEVYLDNFPGYETPAASQYVATSPRLLKWFAQYNVGKPYPDQVKPFNFLLSLQVRSDIDLTCSGDGVLHDLDGKTHIPRAVSPYFKRPTEAAAHAFDRRTGEPIAPDLLKSHARSLIYYHLHPEGKFHGGDYDQRGVMRRRHVHALTFQAIGKEADNIEAQEYVQDEEGPIKHALADQERARLAAFIAATQAELGFSDRDLCGEANASHHTLAKLRNGEPVEVKVVVKLAIRAEELRQAHLKCQRDDDALLERALAEAERLGGISALAKTFDLTRQNVGRVLRKERPISEAMRALLSRL